MIISASIATLGAIFGGLAGFGGMKAAKEHEKGHNEGYKEGWSDASKTYEEKFKALRNEAQKAYGIISEQKRLLREADELIADMQAHIDVYKAIGLTVEPEIALTYADARMFADDLRRRVA